MATREDSFICTVCPKGCMLKVVREDDTFVHITAGCKRGKDYARQELTDPRRMVATTVKVKGGLHPLLPVYTSAPFPKLKIRDLLSEIRKIEITTPIKMEQIILENVLGTGINILASRNMDAVQKSNY